MKAKNAPDWTLGPGAARPTILLHFFTPSEPILEAFLLSTGIVALAEMGDFIAMAVWMLIPDSVDDDEASGAPRLGVFGTTVVAFFLAEMGDKTQIATVMLAAQYQAWAWVVAGTTLGMMLANAPVVWLGEKITKMVPLKIVHLVSALVFLVLGFLALLA